MIESAKYTESGSISAVIDAQEMVVPDDMGNRHRAMIAEWEAVGNEIEPYAEPILTPEEQRALMPPLEKWRFDTIIDSRPGLRDKIETAIERNISDLLQRVTVRNKFRSVTQFSRLDPMFPFLASDPDININELEIDEMWRQGLALT